MRNELNKGFSNNRFPLNTWRRKTAKNRSYDTISYVVDWDRLTKVCPSTMIFKYE